MKKNPYHTREIKEKCYLTKQCAYFLLRDYTLPRGSTIGEIAKRIKYGEGNPYHDREIEEKCYLTTQCGYFLL